MSTVIATCQKLAEELVASPEYLRVKAAEERALADADAVLAMSGYQEKMSKLQDLMQQEQQGPEEMRALTRDLQESEQVMRANPKIAEMMAAQNALSQLLRQVNTILQNALSPKSEDGCGGSCDSCGGGCTSCSGCGE
nr:YlbF family regulator [Maliibacterium massiliense]